MLLQWMEKYLERKKGVRIVNSFVFSVSDPTLKKIYFKTINV